MVVLWLACLSVGMAAKRCFPHPGGFETFKWVPSLTQPELLELRQYRPLWLLYCRLWGKMEEGGDARRSCFPGHPIDLYKKVDIQSKNLYSKTIMGGAIIFFGRGGGRIRSRNLIRVGPGHLHMFMYATVYWLSVLRAPTPTHPTPQPQLYEIGHRH